MTYREKRAMRGSVRMVLVEKSVYGSLVSDMDSARKATKAIRWLQEMVDSAPAEYRDAVCVSIHSVSGYDGDHNVELEIYYDRPETDVEWQARLTRHEKEDARAAEAEKRQYAALKAKYEGT